VAVTVGGVGGGAGGAVNAGCTVTAGVVVEAPDGAAPGTSGVAVTPGAAVEVAVAGGTTGVAVTVGGVAGAPGRSIGNVWVS
jgi:hypothetical protein